MSSSRKTFKSTGKNKNPRANIVGNSSGKDDQQSAKLIQQKSKIDRLLSASGDHFAINTTACSRLVLSRHRVWPDLPQTQSVLFFECTLFLYSVLALFLQYLSLYKTLWWLPKSHWHSSMKFYLINPYVLSCIGLLLGIRVTKCFWCTISDKSAFFLKNYKGWKLATFRTIEISIRLFLLSTVTSSFLFSFSRIYAEFGAKALMWFSYPFVGYFLLIHGNLMHYLQVELARFPRSYWLSVQFWFSIINGIPEIMVRNSHLIDLDSVLHLCADDAARIREEAKILSVDFDTRIRYSIYAGLFTAYFSILMPRLFIPNKTTGGEPMVMLVDDVYVLQLFVIVALTAFLLYATYLLPIQYFDLMHRCAVHLGWWRRIQPNRFNAAQLEESSFVYNIQNNRYISLFSGVIASYNGEFYESKSHPGFKTVAAQPGNGYQLRFYKTAHDPVLLVSYMCVFQLLLVGAQFWALILSTDWQKIVTFVLLMFANYLLLAKIFKDRVVIGRIFKPSAEDQHLIAQLQKEFHQRQQQQEQQHQKQRQNQTISNSKQHLKIA